ncbi:ABC transporter family substrate-binding protein [Mycolicibacterium neoaurum]|uniref:ABC transporter family substrate-binding protein n=1 Tax=Mycolicibacterium neoaurum TaxID=1795 RepID=UPI002673AF52|nr:ABC transporter family substrate-binding protein [Mycolicibacterium neoaurum]MDO3399911.1 ABC transporter family substrate-binding protein [Mycolicibacterium neoaurum]
MIAIAVSVAAGCGGDTTGEPGTVAAETGGSAQQINAQDPASLRDGGALRIPVDALPTNYNPLQLNGARVVTWQLAEAILPSAFRDGPDGSHELATDYVESAELTSAAPQVVTYRLNPGAVWSNGRPLSWEDFAGQARALSGTDPAYEGFSTTGYSDISTVTRGADDREVVVTFARPFAEWQGLFSLIVPKEVTADPAAFNDGWVREPQITSGPFQLVGIDDTAKTISLERNPSFWGTKPPLESLIFVAMDSVARADALANNEIDIYPIGGDIDLFTRARSMSGVEIRQAPERKAGQVTFNGAPGAPLADEKLRVAVAQAIDPAEVTKVVLGGIVPDAAPVGNHILPPTDAGYRDNSAVLPHDPQAARKALDELGWAPGPDGIRARNGRPLSLRLLTQNTPVGQTVSGVLRDQLTRSGIGVVVESVPPDRFYDGYLIPGNFDVAAFEWTKSSSPFAHDRPVFQQPVGDDIGSNYGRVYIGEIDALYDRGLAELDPQARAEIANEIDVLAWRHAHHLPLYAESGAYAVRTGLANYGARGLGNYGFGRAGWEQ